MNTDLDDIDLTVYADIYASTDDTAGQNPRVMDAPASDAAAANATLAGRQAPTGGAHGGGNGAGNGHIQGLVRPRRRVVGNRNTQGVGATVRRNYQVANTIQFTNFSELKNDMISPEYAQEIIEEVFATVGIDTSNPNATRMAEDVMFIFYIENAASQKTGHEKVIDVYGVEFDMMVVLNVLVSHGITPRRFTRGLATRIHQFLRQPENAALRAELIRRYSLSDPDHAVLAFDGSTHIQNVPVEQIQVANMLATRGIYENTASVRNASERTTFDGVLSANQTGAGALHYGAPSS